MNKFALIAGLTAALLTSGCFIERTVPVAVYPDTYDGRYDDYSSSSSSYGASYGASYGYSSPRPTPGGNHKPILDAISANPSFAVAPGTTITFTVVARDPDSDALQFNWSATAGVLSSDSGRTVAFLPPAKSGLYTVQVVVSDGRGDVVVGSQNIIVDDRGAATVLRPGVELPTAPVASGTPDPVVIPMPSPSPTPFPTASRTPRPIATPTPAPTPTPIPTPLPEEWVTNDADEDEEF